MRLFRLLLAKNKTLPMTTAEMKKPFHKPIQNFWELLRHSGMTWLVIPLMIYAHHAQYINDVRCVAAVRSDVKLFPKKPNVSYKRLM